MENRLPQLRMRRPHLENLPALPEIPPDYVLRELRAEDTASQAALLREAFETAHWTPERARTEFLENPGVKKTCIVAYGGEVVATASALLLPELFPVSGIVHYVAAHPAHRGKRFGWIVSLAVLQEFVRLGCQDATLLTDDARLPAIRTYQSLGFVPEYCHESHPARWQKILETLAD